jgi:hypothetical protein
VEYPQENIFLFWPNVIGKFGKIPRWMTGAF